MVIKILLKKDLLILKVDESIYKIDLSEYGFDHESPIILRENHFINKELIRRIKHLLKPNRSWKSRLLNRDKIFIGVEPITSPIAIEHHSDFGQLIGINNPRVVIKTIPKFEGEDYTKIFSNLDSEDYMIVSEVNCLSF